MNNRKLWIGVTAAALVMACVGACVAVVLLMRYSTDIFVFLNNHNSLKIGSPAPDFALRSLDGGTVQLSQFRGRPVMLTFAASWCPDCRAEAPVQQALHEQHPDLVVLLVDSNEQDAVVRDFAAEFGMTYPVLLDPSSQVSRQYRIFAIPTSFFIDASGVIRGMIIERVTSDVIDENLPLIGVEP